MQVYSCVKICFQCNIIGLYPFNLTVASKQVLLIQ